MAAQKSSYFLLTPATSTTSLHDVSSTSCLQQQQNKLTDIKTNTMKNSKKQQQVEETKENKEELTETKTPATTTTTTTKKTTARKRAATSRRRPSIILCNTSVSSSSSTSTSTIRRPIVQNVPESKVTSANTNITHHVVAHKQAKLSLSVSAATKSCSNIQKSSVLADVAVVSEASKPPTTTFSNPIGAGVSLSQFYLRYAPKNSFYSTTASVRSCHRKFGPSNPMPELTWASSSALWSAMKDKEQNYLRDAAYLKRHPGI